MVYTSSETALIVIFSGFLCLLPNQAVCGQKTSLNFDRDVLVERLLNDFTRNVADDLLLHLAAFE